MAESESKTGIVKFEDVLDRELIAITTRRKRAGLVDSVVTSATTTPATSDAQTSAASDADSNTARETERRRRI